MYIKMALPPFVWVHLGTLHDRNKATRPLGRAGLLAPDFVNAYPKNHLRKVERCVGGVS